MGKELIVVKEKSPDMELQIRRATEWLGSIKSQVSRELESDPKSAMHTLKNLDMFVYKAQKVKIMEIVREANVTKLHVCREIGSFLLKHNKLGNKHELTYDALGLARRDGMIYKQLAQMEDYAWTHALKLTPNPTVATVKRESDRYLKIKTILETHKVKNKPEMMKNYIINNFTPMHVESELSPKKKKTAEDLEDEWQLKPGERLPDGLDDDDDKSNLIEAEAGIFVTNAGEIEKSCDDFISILQHCQVVKKETYRNIMKGLKTLEGSIRNLRNNVEDIKSKIV